MARQCRGCGAKIQTENPQMYGYVPPHLLDEEGDVICQRCFRISNYGKDDLGPVLADNSMRAIHSGVEWANRCLLVVDLIDFEAGLPPELVDLVGTKPMLVVANKADLLPKQTPLPEAEQWVKARLQSLGIAAEVVVVSAVSGTGFPELAAWIESHPGKLLFAGVTNVGKSRVIGRLLSMRLGGGRRGKLTPTVSPYPGTTVEWSRWKIAHNSVLADSPGYVPQGRLSDTLCADCARSLIPDRKLSSKLYPFKDADLLYIPGRAGVVCQKGHGQGLLIGYTGSGVTWEKSSAKHLDKWLYNYDGHCPVAEWETADIVLHANHDLLIHGLGWISARKSDFDLRLYLPQGVQVTLRPNLIGIKR